MSRSARNFLALFGVVVLLIVIVALGPLRSKLKSVFGAKATTTTVQTRPIAVPVPEGFRIGQVLFRLHSEVPSLDVENMRQMLASGQVTSTLLPPGGVPASVIPPSGSPMEGLLFPATYSVPPGSNAMHVLTEMAQKMETETASLGIADASARLRLTPYQLIIVASMVERETGNPDEAPKIARVIYNRLAKNQPIGIDATLQYLHCTRVTEGDCPPVTVAELTTLKKDPSPYNTYVHVGLPPTPIGAPGDSALTAALNPADGTWLYYVRSTTNDAQGRPQHLFFDNDTGPEYKQAVDACRAANLGC
ncbi:MAG: endolytic transglycosylase MltG [Acidimicrobiales bacterium]